MKLKVKRESLWLLLSMVIIFAVLEPTAFIGTWIHSVCGVIRRLGFFSSILLYFKDEQYKNGFENLLIGFIFMLGLSTIVYSGDFSNDYLYFMRVSVTLIVFLQYWFKCNPCRICKSVGMLLSAFLVLDAMTWVLPGLGEQVGASIHCFLGTKTTITYYLIPAIAFDFAYYSICSNKEKKAAKRLIALALGGTVAYLFQMPISTTIVCLFLIVCVWLLMHFNSKSIRFLSRHGFWISTVLILILVGGTSIGFVDFIITNVLGESSDLTGRRSIWDMALMFISQRPFLGYGVSTGINLNAVQTTNASAHNFFLGLLMKSGLAGFLYYAFMIICLHMKNNKRGDNAFKLKQFLMCMLVIMNIEGLSEEFITYPVTIALLFLVGSTQYLLGREKGRYKEGIIE